MRASSIILLVFLLAAVAYGVVVTRSNQRLAARVKNLQTQNNGLRDSLKLAENTEIQAQDTQRRAFETQQAVEKNLARLQAELERKSQPPRAIAVPPDVLFPPPHVPAAPPELPSGTLTTREGKIFHDAQILQVGPDAVTLLDDQGLASVPIATLPAHLQEKLDYQPAPTGTPYPSTAESIAAANQDDFSRFSAWLDGDITAKVSDGYTIAVTVSHAAVPKNAPTDTTPANPTAPPADLPYLPRGTYHLITTLTYLGHVHIRVYPINGTTFSDDMADAYELRK